MAHPKNRTPYKTLDKLAADPRVEEIWEEGVDGIWVALNPGFQWEECHSVHEWSVKDVLVSFRSVEPCLCLECHPGPIE